jgi:hypothetical protein
MGPELTFCMACGKAWWFAIPLFNPAVRLCVYLKTNVKTLLSY